MFATGKRRLELRADISRRRCWREVEILERRNEIPSGLDRELE